MSDGIVKPETLDKLLAAVLECRQDLIHEFNGLERGRDGLTRFGRLLEAVEAVEKDMEPTVEEAPEDLVLVPPINGDPLLDSIAHALSLLERDPLSVHTFCRPDCEFMVTVFPGCGSIDGASLEIARRRGRP